MTENAPAVHKNLRKQNQIRSNQKDFLRVSIVSYSVKSNVETLYRLHYY